MRSRILFYSIIYTLSLNGCNKKALNNHTFNDAIPDHIETVFFDSYSDGLSDYKWKLNEDDYEVHFVFQRINKIGTYGNNGVLKQMQTQIQINPEIRKEFYKYVGNKCHDCMIKNCFWVLKKDSIFYRVNYKKNGIDTVAYLPVTCLPQ